MKFLICLTVLFFAAFSYSQTTDHAGYYITNTGEKVEGYFKHGNFHNSNSLEFKSSLTGEYENLAPDNIIEYGIGSEFKFVKKTIKIDKSDNNNVKMYSSVKDPQLVTETLFLNVLVEGQDASLYSADINKSIRYFYTLRDKTHVTQLIYKKYASVQGITSINKDFQRQLYTDLNCKNEPVDKFSLLEYDRDELVNFFISYNTCKGTVPIAYANKGGKKIKFLYNVFAGIYNNTLTIEGERLPKSSSTAISYGFGGELAFLVPSGKWELFLRAEYEILKGEATGYHKTSYNEQTTIAEVDGKAINVYVGSRYNITINDKSKIFADAAIGLNSPSGKYRLKMLVTTTTGLTYESFSRSYTLHNSASFNFGIGYTYSNKFGFRIMYESTRNMFDVTDQFLSSGINRYGINFRYTLN